MREDVFVWCSSWIWSQIAIHYLKKQNKTKQNNSLMDGILLYYYYSTLLYSSRAGDQQQAPPLRLHPIGRDNVTRT